MHAPATEGERDAVACMNVPAQGCVNARWAAWPVFIDDIGRHRMGTDDEVRAVRARMTMRDNDRLREDLKLIGEVGWEHPSATALLQFVREDLVRPMVIGEGLRGLAAWQAEASGWAVAWEMLRSSGS